MTTKRISVTLIDEMLGTNPGDKEIHERFINSKAPDAETREQELTHLPPEEMVSKEMTVFCRDDESCIVTEPRCKERSELRRHGIDQKRKATACQTAAGNSRLEVIRYGAITM